MGSAPGEVMGRKPTKNLNLPKGMRARPKAGGVIWYYLDAGKQADGKRLEIPLGNDYLIALRKYAELMVTASAPPVTVPEMLTRFQVETMIGRTKGTLDDIRWSMPHLIKFFSDPSPAPLDAVEPLHITQYRRWRSKTTETQKGAPVRANREISWLSAAWNWARSEGLTSAQNPCIGVKKNKEDGRDIYVEDDELALITKHADEPLREALEMGHLIGQRPGDLRGMSETDIRNGYLEVEQDKTGAKLRIEVIGDLFALVEQIKARKASIKGVRSLSLLCDEKGQPLTKGKMRYRFDKAREQAAEACENEEQAARIRSLQFRDLRAKNGTDKAEKEGLRAAQGLLGHTSQAMTEHYTRNRRGASVKPLK
jgi:integrase